MRVFRTTYKDRNGQTQTAAKWYIEFTDHRETTRRLPACTDKKQSEAIGRNVERLVGCRLAGEKPAGDLGRWVETLSITLKDKLAKLDLLSVHRMAAGKPLAEHLLDFRAALLAKGSTPKHADLTFTRAKAVLDGCQFRFWSELSASKVQRFLADKRGPGDDNAKSTRTTNDYL